MGTKLETAPEKPGEVLLLLVCGCLGIGMLYLFYQMMAEALHYPKLVVFCFVGTGVLIPLITLLGSVTFGLVARVLGAKPAKCPCGSANYNMISEWFHKRKCLAYLTNSVGK